MTEHVCDPVTDPGGGVVTQARALRLLIAIVKREPDLDRVALEQTGGCPRCSATLFFGMAAMTVGAITGVHGPNALMMLELQLAGAEAAVGDADQ